MHAAVIVNATGTCETLTPAEWAILRGKALRRAANANAAKHYWCGRRSPASFPWGAVLTVEAE